MCNPVRERNESRALLARNESTPRPSELANYSANGWAATVGFASEARSASDFSPRS